MVPQSDVGYFDYNNDIDCMLKLHKSLYGMFDAPLLFFELLKKNLLSVGFKQFDHIDPCLFVHKKAICLTYVDDCIIVGNSLKEIDDFISNRCREDRKNSPCDIDKFLGVEIVDRGRGEFEMKK